MECRTAQRISDIKAFDKRDLQGMVWVNRVNKGERTLGKVVRIRLNTAFTRPAYEIPKKYDLKHPEVSEQKLNKNIKTLCKLAGINAQITKIQWRQNQKIETTKPKHDWISTHTGRKTFITIALQYMKPKLVKDIAGISWSTLKHYEGNSEGEVLTERLNAIPEPSLKIAMKSQPQKFNGLLFEERCALVLIVIVLCFALTI